ncbi:hypothetical protein PENTCL1PPCAC_28115, partial [Pristionchus entomophagus]
QNQLTLLVLCAIASTAYSIHPCADFCQGTVLGTSRWCWCNSNYKKCYNNCIQRNYNTAPKTYDFSKCIPEDETPNINLWRCCMKKNVWNNVLKCDPECWSTALPTREYLPSRY